MLYTQNRGEWRIWYIYIYIISKRKWLIGWNKRTLGRKRKMDTMEGITHLGSESDPFETAIQSSRQYRQTDVCVRVDRRNSTDIVVWQSGAQVHPQNVDRTTYSRNHEARDEMKRSEARQDEMSRRGLLAWDGPQTISRHSHGHILNPPYDFEFRTDLAWIAQTNRFMLSSESTSDTYLFTTQWSWKQRSQMY